MAKTMLSKHFSADEFKCSATGACEVKAELLLALEDLRAAVSKKLGKDTPLKVLSGYRSPEHNEEIGGATKSEHTTGRAADVAVPKGLSQVDMYRLAEGIPAFKDGGIGLYPDNGFVHVDVRGRKARWARVGGKYVGVDVVLAANKQRGKA